MKNFELISQKFDVDEANALTEEQFLYALAGRISEMLDNETELLFSTLYRLDIFESKINDVLRSGEDTSLGLAGLVIERQKEKIISREAYRDHPIESKEFPDDV